MSPLEPLRPPFSVRRCRRRRPLPPPPPPPPPEQEPEPEPELEPELEPEPELEATRYEHQVILEARFDELPRMLKTGRAASPRGSQ